MGSWWLQCWGQSLHLQTTQMVRGNKICKFERNENEWSDNDAKKILKDITEREIERKKERESIVWLLFSTSSLVHVLSITPASLFLPYFQHTYLPCQQHARQINRKYTHAYKHTGKSASNIPTPNWPEYNSLLLIQSELPPEAIFQLNQRKNLAGRPRPLCVQLDEWKRHYENGQSSSFFKPVLGCHCNLLPLITIILQKQNDQSDME